MTILLVCNNKNLLGNKLIIYTTLFCNSGVTWIICLTEDIGEKELINIQNLIAYLDSSSSVIFDQINENEPLENQFSYLSNFLYISADCMVAQSIDDIYSDMIDDNCSLVITQDNSRYCVFFINLNHTRAENKNTYIKIENGIIIELIDDDLDFEYFDPRIGYNGTFSFHFSMPIIFWFSKTNLSVYDTTLENWYKMYPDFQPYIEQIQLAETIYF